MNLSVACRERYSGPRRGMPVKNMQNGEGNVKRKARPEAGPGTSDRCVDLLHQHELPRGYETARLQSVQVRSAGEAAPVELHAVPSRRHGGVDERGERKWIVAGPTVTL